MILFALYPVLYWGLAIRWRRRALGLLIVAMGAMILLGVCVVHARAPAFLPWVEYVQVAQSVLWPYSFLVPVIALYCFCLPRRAATDCVACGYAMAGLEGETDTCPECGRVQPWAVRVQYRPSGASRGPLHRSDAPSVRRPAMPVGSPTTGGAATVGGPGVESQGWRGGQEVPGFTGLSRRSLIDGGRSEAGLPSEETIEPTDRQHAEG